MKQLIEPTFGPLIGISIEQLNDKTIFARYGLLRNGYDYHFITVKEAYADYNPIVSLASLSSNKPHPDSNALESDSHDADIGSSESNAITIDQPSPIPPDVKCHLL